jgi:undecaprenyl phosphate-alpha-L-ara4FN deformylase
VVQATVGLRVDVDTRRGLDEGVPRLLELFRGLDVRASFFVTMGPDRSGTALRRAWRPSFLAKMWRTRAWRLYGLRTILSGTILRARPVGCGSPALLHQVAGAGHEVAPHGFDHARWQDGVHRLPPASIRDDLARAANGFRIVMGTEPLASAAPGWRTTPAALVTQEQFGYRYASDVRGHGCFRPMVSEHVLATLQVPTTMPTVDELLGRVRDIPAALVAAIGQELNVFTLHAEVEGGPWLATFRAFLERAHSDGVRFVPLVELATRWARGRQDVVVCPIVQGRVPGRSGWVAIQGKSERGRVVKSAHRGGA